MPSKIPHGQPWWLDATRTLRYLPRLQLTGRSMAYMPRQSLHPLRRLRRERFWRNSMVYSGSNDEFANLRRLIFTLLFLIKVIPSGALKDISDELNHDLQCHHRSGVDDKEDNFPLLTA